MQARGLTIPVNYIQRGEQSEETGHHACAQWMQLPKAERPTAVVAITDLVAIGVMYGAEAHGMVIGQDLSVIGFDNAPLAQYVRPGLTTMQQAIPEITQALLTMLQTILNKNETLARQVLIAPDLIIRNSCGFPTT